MINGVHLTEIVALGIHYVQVLMALRMNWRLSCMAISQHAELRRLRFILEQLLHSSSEIQPERTMWPQPPIVRQFASHLALMPSSAAGTLAPIIVVHMGNTIVQVTFGVLATGLQQGLGDDLRYLRMGQAKSDPTFSALCRGPARPGLIAFAGPEVFRMLVQVFARWYKQ